MRLAWFHCFSGIAGDMALGSLIDAGADVEEVRRLLQRLPVAGWELEAEPVLRGGIAATKVHVHAEDHTVSRTAAHIQALVEEARLPDRLRNRALATFSALARAEAKLHRRPAAQVHFHEVGGIDAIVDVVGTCAALELLDVDEIRSSPVTTGMGMVRSAHGLIPNPAPAVVELLHGAPTAGLDLGVELTTPTGAALLAANCRGWGPLPAMDIETSGFGAGTRDLDGRPNATQVVLGQADPRRDELATDAGGELTGQPVVLLETNIDDATGEVLAHAVERLLAGGAHDAWLTTIVMKKGRPAHTLHALADVALAPQLVRVMTDETGTMGVRGQTLQRWPARRRVEEVLVEGLPVRVKVSPGRAKAEHDDARRVAERTGRPLRTVLADAERSWHERSWHERSGHERSPEEQDGEPPSDHLHAVPDGSRSGGTDTGTDAGGDSDGDDDDAAPA